jgi:hypothetical protein
MRLAPGEHGTFTYEAEKRKLRGTFASAKIDPRAGWIDDGRTRASLDGVKKSRDADGHWHVSATLQNDGETPCLQPSVTFAYVEADGRLWSSEARRVQALLHRQLAPGARVAMPEEMLYDFDHKASDLRLGVSCDYEHDGE